MGAEEREQEQEHQDPETDATPSDDSPDDNEEPPQRTSKKPKQRPERQAAAYRVQRNEARKERDELRLELAFNRAAGDRFVDIDAAFKLVDRSILTLDIDGTPVGAVEAVEALADTNPFLLAADDEPTEKKERNPFAAGRSSGKTMNGKRKPFKTGHTRTELEQKYPALRRGR